MNSLLVFYNKIQQLLKETSLYEEEQYLPLKEIAVFILASRDFNKSIQRMSQQEIKNAIDVLYIESPILFKPVNVSSFQSLLRDFGSHLKAKDIYNKIDYLSVLTSIPTWNEKIQFTRKVSMYAEVTNIGHEVLEANCHCLSIDEAKYSGFKYFPAAS